MITDITLFKGLLVFDSDEIADYINDIIDQKEPELLERWFGYALTKDLLSATPSTESQKLIDGFEYTDDNNDLKKIVGLSDSLPYFMYFYIVRDLQTNETSIGGVSASVENSVKIIPIAKLCQEYNKGIRDVNNMIEYINDNDDVYTTYVYKGYFEPINLFGI